MRFVLSTGLAVGLSAAAGLYATAAQAATSVLSYDLNLLTSDIFLSNGMVEYDGPEVGETVQRGYSFTVDLDESSFSECSLDNPFDCTSYSYDLNTGAFSYASFLGDNALVFDLEADGTGSLSETIETQPGGLFYYVTSYEVASWEVSGLPDVAPVPLPASLPLLLAGLGAAGMIARKRNS